jgi:hypothetical protein
MVRFCVDQHFSYFRVDCGYCGDNKRQPMHEIADFFESKYCRKAIFLIRSFLMHLPSAAVAIILSMINKKVLADYIVTDKYNNIVVKRPEHELFGGGNFFSDH